MVTKEDDISHSVSVFIAPDKLITFSMEDRDANEFAIVLAGYFRLIAGKVVVFHFLFRFIETFHFHFPPFNYTRN